MPLDNVASRRAGKAVKTVRENYVKRLRDNYLLILRTLMHDLIVSIDKDGNFVFVNDATVEFWGKSSKKIIGTHFTEYLHPEDIKKTITALQDLIENKSQVKSFMIRTKSPRGIRTVAWNAIAIFDDEGNYVGAQATGKDLTDLICAKEELKQSKQHLNTLFEVIVDPIIIVDMKGNFLELSQSAEEILGLPKEELVGKHFLDSDATTVESKAIMEENLEKIRNGMYIELHTIEAVTKDGKKLLYELNTTRIMYKGEPAVLGIFRNITKQKKTEKALREAEEKYREAIVNANVGIICYSPECEVKVLNPKMEQMTGFKRSEIPTLRDWFKKLYPNEEERCKVRDKWFKRMLEEGEVKEGHAIITTKDGKRRNFLFNSVHLESGDSIAFAEDITERKQMENKILQQNEFLNSALEALIHPFYVIDADDYTIQLANSATGFANLAENRTCYQVTHKRKKPCSAEHPCPLEIVKKTKKPAVTEHIHIDKNGNKRNVEVHGYPIFDNNGNIVQMIETSLDITERKKAEEALRASEGRFRELSELLPEVIFETNTTGVLTFVNQVAFELFGFSREDFEKGLFLRKFLIPEDQERAMKNMDRVLSGEKLGTNEYTGVKKGGNTFPFLAHCSSIIHENKPVGVRGVIVDITDRKEVAEALRREQEMLEIVTANINAGLVVVSKDYIVLWANKVLKKYLGDIEGKPCYSALNQRSSTCPKCGVQEIFDTGKDLVIHEQEVPSPTGQIWLEIAATAIRDEKGEIVAASEMALDITERKKTELALKASEQKFRAIFEGATDGILAVDPETFKFVFANPRMREITGYPFGELLKLGISDIVRKEDLPFAVEQFKKQLDGKLTLTRNLPVLRKDKKLVYCDVSSRLLKIGNEQCLLGFFRDTTEIRKIEEAKNNLLHVYGERVKELSCLYGISKLVEKPRLSLEEIIRGIVDLLSPAWQYPDIACARIVFEEQEFKTKNFKETRWKQQAEIKVHGKRAGTVEVYYLEEKPTFDEGPFLKEERDLIEAIAKRLGKIIEHKKAQETLRASEKRFRELSELLPETVFEMDMTGKLTFVNRAAFEKFGYSQEDLEKGLNVFHLLAPEDREKAKKNMGRILSGEVLGATEYMALRKDGSKFPFITHTNAIIRENKPVGMRGVIVDITERKKMEVELKRVASDLTRLIDTANAPIFGIDRDGQITEWNQTSVRITGYAKEETIGKNLVDDFITHDYKASVKEVLDNALQGENTANFEFPLYTKDGQHVDLLLNATSRRDASGNVIGVIGVGQDITEMKKVQEAISKANRLLKQSNEELESYTYVVSHDLKAPLRTIQSFGGFLLEDYGKMLDETGQDYLQRMVNASSHMNAMIEDLLVLSRVGRKFTKVEKTDLNTLLDEALADLEMTIKERNAEVVVDKLPVISIQRMWIKQLFMNLIDNGLKFNKSKTPKVEVLHQERENDHLFMVRDNGIGIEEKHLERIFNLFEKLHTRKEYKGTGAGLAICKKIVEQLGGKIWVESTLGEGSTFLFTTPKKIKQTEEAKI